MPPAALARPQLSLLLQRGNDAPRFARGDNVQGGPLNIAIWLLAFACASLIVCLLLLRTSPRRHAFAVGRAGRGDRQRSGEDRCRPNSSKRS